MATTRYTIASTDGWTKIADAADAEFYIENVTSIPVLFHYGTVAPAIGDTGYHILSPRESITRQASGDLYVRTEYADASGVIIASVG